MSCSCLLMKAQALAVAAAGRAPRGVLSGLVALAAVAAACAPVAPGARLDGAPAAPGALKVLQLGLVFDAEPSEGGIAYGGSGAGGSEAMFLLHAGLTVFDDQANLQPRLAERVPTVDNGDWKLLPDGGMQVTWKLRSGVRWHDGTPLTADDFLLGYRVGADPQLFRRGTRVLRQIAEVAAPDPQTLVVHWKNVYIQADDMGLHTLVPLHPRFGPLYDAGDKQAFMNSSYWFDEWVGLGPFRMREWLRGSYIEADAYDDYFLGRPSVDRIVMRYYGDSNALIVATMAGDVTVIPVGSLKEDAAHVLKAQWADQGSGQVLLSNNKLRQGIFHFRDASAPWVADARVRLALAKLIDREGIVATVKNGLSSVEDQVLPRHDSAYRLAQQRGLPNFSHDVNQAHRLLADAGLSRAADGTYRLQGGGPFAVELSTTGDINSNVQELLAISNQWKGAGLETTNLIITGAMDKDEIRSTTKGVHFTSATLGYVGFENYITAEISTRETRWKGSNFGGYTNPLYDQQFNRLLGTVSSSERAEIAAALMKTTLDEVLYIPLSYSADVSTFKKGVGGVTGVLPQQRVTGWNAHLWTLG